MNIQKDKPPPKGGTEEKKQPGLNHSETGDFGVPRQSTLQPKTEEAPGNTKKREQEN